MLKKVYKGLVSAALVASTIMTTGASGIAAGTQKAYVVGDDWGCGVAKTIVTLNHTIDASSVSAEDFSVTEVKGTAEGTERTILDAYVSDENGNKVTTDSNIVTIEMAITPSEGSPISWSMATWRNTWADPYELHVAINEGEEITTKGESITELAVVPGIDVANTMLCPQLDGFAIHNDGFTSSEGTVVSYALYTPAKDSHKNPLVIWNHGIGETGTDVKIDLLGNEVTALGGAEFQGIMDGAYVLVPQRRGYNDTAAVIELVKETIANNPDIDADRVIVGGCSAGGGTTLAMIKADPDLYAAAYPICPAGAISAEEAVALKDLPIWFIHSADDTTVKIEGSMADVENLKAAGNTNVHTTFMDHVYDTTGRFTKEDGSTYTYNGHWSWVTFDNNECYDDADPTLNCWEWMAQQSKSPITKLAGTQKVVVTGDDWGCGVTKTVIEFEKAIKAGSVDAKDFAVEQLTGTRTAARKVTDAYVSDAKGNKVTTDSKYVTVEMYISPSEGSPFVWNQAAFSNSWANPFALYVTYTATGSIETAEGPISYLDIKASVDVTADENRIIPQLDGFTYGEYTDSEGGKTVYGLYAPEADDHKNALVIWNHGGGEYGTDVLIDLLANEVTAYASEEFQAVMDGAYVLVPQRRRGEGETTTKTIGDLILKVMAENPDIDPNHVVIGGCSAGGMFTLQMILAYPDMFSAAFPICPARTLTEEEAETIKDLPIWFTIAMNDTTCTYADRTKPCLDALAAVGAKEVHTSIFEDVHDTSGRFKDENGNPHQYSGHWSWIYVDNNECYSDQTGENLWQWLAKTVKVEATPDTPVVPDVPSVPTVGIHTSSLALGTMGLALAAAFVLVSKKRK